MKYTEEEVKKMQEKINSYERIINRMLLKFHKIEMAKKKGLIHEECIIHLSFSGLNKAFSLKDDNITKESS